MNVQAYKIIVTANLLVFVRYGTSDGIINTSQSSINKNKVLNTYE